MSDRNVNITRNSFVFYSTIQRFKNDRQNNILANTLENVEKCFSMFLRNNYKIPLYSL